MPSVDGTAAQPLTRRLQRAKSRKGRFLLATFQEVVESIRPDAACLQVPFGELWTLFHREGLLLLTIELSVFAMRFGSTVERKLALAYHWTRRRGMQPGRPAAS